MSRPPLWWQVSAVALDKADAQGVASLEPGELRAILGAGVSSAATTRAIRAAVRFGLLRTGSGARVLLLPSPDRQPRAEQGGTPYAPGTAPPSTRPKGGTPTRQGAPSTPHPGPTQHGHR